MFCVIYEFKVRKGQEGRFCQVWQAVTSELTCKYGSLGARLHRSEEGGLVAYAQWVDKGSWETGHKVVELEASKLKVEECLLEDPLVLRHLHLLDDLTVTEAQCSPESRL